MNLDSLTFGMGKTYRSSNAWRFEIPPMTNEIYRRVGGVLVALRREDKDKICHLTTDIMAWVLSLCCALELDLNKTLGSKFPGCCPYCLEKPCSCAKDKPPRKDSIIFSKELSLREWQELLGEIYTAKHANRDNLLLGYKLAEEAAELVTSNFEHSDNRAEFEDELADLVSWLVAIANKHGFILEDELLSRYSGFCCPKCQDSPCTCSSRDISESYR